MAAFMSSTPVSLTSSSSPLLSKPRVCSFTRSIPSSSPRSRRVYSTPSMSFYSPMDSMLSKYNTLAKEPSTTSKPVTKASSIWSTFVRDNMRYSAAMPGPYVTTEDATQTFTYFMYQMQSGARSFTAPGGTPKSRLSDVADAYMSSCIKSSLKSEIGASSGVYTPACTEGTIRDMADQSRVLALSSAHKRTTLQKASPSAGFGTMFDIRRRALILAGDCSYEQSLVIKFPKAAAAFVAASNEAAGLCTRAFDDGSGGGMSIAEKYMMEKVDFQGKMKLGMETPGSGVYSTTCSDAAVSGDAEQKRVIGLAARFRAKATSPMRKAQMEFDARKAARVLYGKECAYEEGLFNKYPAVAAAMAGTGQGALY